jgi:hypothetical protein
VAIVVIAAIAKGSHGGGGGGGHGGGGGGGGAGHIAASAGRGIGHVASHVAARVALRTIDAFGRTAEVIADHPEWASEPGVPHGGDSQMYLEMTLVDNHTGLALWHGHQTFPASAAKAGDVERAARTILASLPAR